MNRLQFLKALDAVELLCDWAEIAEEVDEGEWMLAQTVVNALTAFGLLTGLLEHDSVCDRCSRRHFESQYDNE